MFMVHIYRNAFRYFAMGYASALAVVLFVAVLVLTLAICGPPGDGCTKRGVPDRHDRSRRDATAPPLSHTELRSRRRRRLRVRWYLGVLVRHALLMGVAVGLLVPFCWMLLSAFKDTSQMSARPIQWWPNPVRWDNFMRALTYPGFPFLQFLWNSVFYAGLVSLERCFHRLRWVMGSRP